MIQGRPVAAWLAEVEIGGFIGAGNPALNVLNSAGPSIMAQLTHLTRDPSATLQAKAAYTINGICCRQPEAPEVHAAVPSFIQYYYSRVRAIADAAPKIVQRGAPMTPA